MKVKAFVGLTLTLAVVATLLVTHRPSTQAQSVASISLPEPGSTKQLYPGCNNITLTFPEGTSSMTVIEAVTPSGSVDTMWQHNAAERRWEGFSAPSPSASDLLSVGFLDAVWLCTAGAPRPPAATASPAPPTAPATAPPGPAATASPAPTAGTSTPAPTATASSPTATPVTTPLPSPTPQTTANAAVAPPDALSSFAYSMETTVDLGMDLGLTIGTGGVFKAPDSTTCLIDVDVLGLQVVIADLVVIGDDAWVKKEVDDWIATPASYPGVVESLKQCPGSSLFWEAVKVPDDLSGVQGQLTTVNGVSAVRLSLEGLVEGLPIFGAPVTGLEGIIIYNFDMWLAQDGRWVVAMEYDIGLSSGPSDGSGEELRIQMRVDVTRPNDPSIKVVPPI